jgi:hypothetical protein
MPKALTVSVDHKPDGTASAKFSAYALALTATRQQGGRGELRQEADWTSANSDPEAHAEGLEIARQKWPAEDGWTHHVAIRKVTVALDLVNKNA